MMLERDMAACGLAKAGQRLKRAMGYQRRSIYSSLSKVEDSVHEHEKASQRLASLQAMSPATDRRYIAPPPDLTRDKLL
jgi:hypothetical protein